MRLEINAGGLDRFINGVSGFINRARHDSASSRLIRGLDDVISRTDNLNGGIGALSPALGSIRARIRMEDSRRTAIETVQRRTNEFINIARDTDNRVATMVDNSFERFYRVNPWLRPPVPPTIRERVRRGVRRVLVSAAETAIRAWNGVVDWYRENRDIINRFLIGGLAILGALAITVLTGGAALPFLIKAGVVVGIGMAAGGTYAAITGGCIWDGISRGFMGAGIGLFALAALGAMGIAGGVLKVTGGALSGGITGGINAAIDGKCIISGVGFGLVLGGAFGFAAHKIGGFFGKKPSSTSTPSASKPQGSPSASKPQGSPSASKPQGSPSASKPPNPYGDIAKQEFRKNWMDYPKDILKDGVKDFKDFVKERLFPKPEAYTN